MKNETIKKLKELKRTLKNESYETIYCKLANILINYDNETQDELYLYDRLKEMYEFVTDDELSELGIIEYEFKHGGLTRLRYFINDTYESDIYIINGYGNLENVNDDTFINAINDMLEMLGSDDNDNE